MDPTRLIDKHIADLGDWRGKTLGDIRRTVHGAQADVVEEWKWKGVPVWSHNGLLCAADAEPKYVKIIFFKGASLPDPEGVFNAELEGNMRRAIKLFEGDRLNARALKNLVRAADTLNASALASKRPKPPPAGRTAAKRR